jgi:glycosyltransferase involved in cell wall biosynthesis
MIIVKIGVNSRIYQEKNGGIQYYIKRLYEKCLEIDKSDQFIFFQSSNLKKIGNTRVLNTFRGSIGSFLFDNFLVNKLIDIEQVDIFHGPANILPIFKKKSVKYIVTIHDLFFLVYPEDINFLYYYYYKISLKRSLSNADVIVADSYSTKKDIIKFYKIPENKIKVVYPGIGNIYFNSPERRKRLVQEKYFFSVTTHRRKNVMSVLEAMGKDERLKDLKYVIAGNIPLDQQLELKTKIEQLYLEKNVLLFGYVTEEQLISLYQNAEFFINPCFYDGFSFPVVEAMASKCPVITSNNSALIELIPDHRWLVNPYDLDDISNKMNQLLDLSFTERQILIDRNYRFAQQFTVKNTAKEMLNIFKSLKCENV